MNHILKSIIILAVVSFIFCANTQNSFAKNLIKNGSFEETKKAKEAWKIIKKQGKPAGKKIKQALHNNGIELITEAEGDEIGLAQDVPVEAGKIYKLSFWAKPQLENAKVNAEVIFKAREGKGRGNRELVSLYKANDWRRYLGYFKAPESVKEVRIIFRMLQTGKGNSSALFDDVELTNVNSIPGGRHIEKNKAPSELMLFSRPWADLIFPDTKPASNDFILEDVLEISSAPGEYEPAAFALFALEGLNDVTINITDLISADKNKIAKENIQTKIVINLKKRVFVDGEEYIENFPSYLEELDKINIPQNTTRWFWLDAYVPKNTKEGVYIGQVEIKSAGTSKAKFNLKLNVYPFTLPPAKPLYAVTFSGDSYKNISQKDNFDAVFKDIKEHGLNSAGVPGPELSEIELKNGVVSFNFSKDSSYVRCMQALKNAGISGPLMVYDSAQSFAAVETLPLEPEIRKMLLNSGHNMGVWKQIGTRLPQFSPEFKGLYLKTINVLKEEHKRRGWPPFYLNPRDEPYDETEKEQNEAIQLLGYLKEIKDTQSSILGNYREWAIEKFAPLADMVVIAGGVPNKEIVAQLKKDGKIVYIYNVDTRGIYPEMLRYTAGFYQWANDLDGLGIWQYQGIFGSACNDLDGNKGDQIYFYPPEGGQEGGPALAWQAYREGIDDYRYLQLLDEVINKTHSSKAKQIRQELNARLDKLIHIDDFRFGCVQWDDVIVGDNDEKFYAGKLKIPNGWDFRDYDDTRRWIANQIVSLLSDLE